MGWMEEAPAPWIAREAGQEPPEEEWTSEDWVWTTLLVERSVDLQATDPGSRLRIATAEAIDRHPLGERVDLVSFGNSVIQGRELPMPARVGPALASDGAGLVEHTRVDLYRAMAGQAHWCEGPEVVVLLCSPHIEVDRRLLYAGPDPSSPYSDAGWPVPPPTDPTLTTREPTIYDERGDQICDMGELRRPGGRHDACILIGAIGGEPSPRLRHLAELSGGVALPVRDADEAEAFAVACHRSFRAVVAAVDQRAADAEAYCSSKSAYREREVEPAEERETMVLDERSTEPDGDVLADQASSFLAVQEALSKWEDFEPGADEFVHVDVLVERSVSSVAADPAGVARRAVVDALHERCVGRSRSLSAYGWGLISTHGLTYRDDFRGPIREALREPNDHSRVDLARACRHLQRLTGPEILIVLGTSAIEPFDVAITGTDYDDGSGFDDRSREPVGDGQRYERDLEGRYPTVVLFGGLDGAVGPELAAWAESTGGAAMPVRSEEEIAAFAERCAEVCRAWIERIEADCTAGVLDLRRIYG